MMFSPPPDFNYSLNGSDDSPFSFLDEDWSDSPVETLSSAGFIALSVFLGLIMTFGFLNNFIVLVLFCRFKTLRTPVNMLLLNISVSDMLVCMCGTTLSFASSIRGRWLLGRQGCMWYGFINSCFGQERYGNMTRVYYREAVGALIAFDVTRATTFDAVLKWKDDLDSKVTLSNGKPVPAVLLANKSDQLRESVCSQIPKLDTFCKENGFVGWFETSAKENTNIEEAARSLVQHILAHEENTVSDARDDTVILPSYNTTTKDRGWTGCSSCSKY